MIYISHVTSDDGEIKEAYDFLRGGSFFVIDQLVKCGSQKPCKKRYNDFYSSRDYCVT